MKPFIMFGDWHKIGFPSDFDFSRTFITVEYLPEWVRSDDPIIHRGQSTFIQSPDTDRTALAALLETLSGVDKKMTLVETSEREVLAAAKEWAEAIRLRLSDDDPGEAEVAATVSLHDAVILLIERERVAAQIARKSETANPATVSADTLHDLDTSKLREYQMPPGDTQVGSVENMVAPTVFAEGTRRRKLSRREQEIEKRRRSDPLGEGRDDIDYSSIEDPEVR